jgi:DNA modification methylase
MNKIEFGDCRDTMRKWKDQGIKAQTCVTSPPYFGLRDYGHDGQIGMEETPEEYIAAMVEVFRCVWDVLEDDGTLWLNIGDSYCNSNGFARASPEYQREGRNNMPANDRKLDKLHATGLKTKDLIGIPWMLAFALRADGWYLRQDIIWHKPNPMPESVQDRCTRAHEYIFLLSKSAKYYYDADAMKEEATSGSTGAAASFKRIDSKRELAIPGQSVGTHRPDRDDESYNETRNKRSVWSVPVKPYAGAHFAVFPTELIEPCILAGAPVGGIVLDPFMGSGTTAQVAQTLGRQYLGCELNENYKPLQNKRIAQYSLDFA